MRLLILFRRLFHQEATRETSFIKFYRQLIPTAVLSVKMKLPRKRRAGTLVTWQQLTQMINHRK